MIRPKSGRISRDVPTRYVHMHRLHEEFETEFDREGSIGTDRPVLRLLDHRGRTEVWRRKIASAAPRKECRALGELETNARVVTLR